MIKFERKKKLNKTGKTMIIIIIGFICTVIVGVFAFQRYVSKINVYKKNNPKILHITIDAPEAQVVLPYYLIIQNDTVLRSQIAKKKQVFQLSWKWNGEQSITHVLGDTIYEQKNVFVADSIAYSVITLEKDSSNFKKMLIKAAFCK